MCLKLMTLNHTNSSSLPLGARCFSKLSKSINIISDALSGRPRPGRAFCFSGFFSIENFMVVYVLGREPAVAENIVPPFRARFDFAFFFAQYAPRSLVKRERKG